MLGLSLPIPMVSGLLDKLDKMKGDFLAIPANVRAAKDKLARVRRVMNRNNAVTVEANEAALVVERGLARVQVEWDTAAQRFSMLDNARRDGTALSADGITIASQLVTSAAYVIKNANANIAAVDALAAKYLTPEERAQLQVATVGVPSGVFGMSLPVALALGIGALFLMRKR